MSKRREYQNLPATDAPQQKPGTTRQAKSEKAHERSEIMTHHKGVMTSHQVKRKDRPGIGSPIWLGDEEVP